MVEEVEVLSVVIGEVVMVVASEEEEVARVTIVGGWGIWRGIVTKVVGVRDTVAAVELEVEMVA